MNRYQAVRPGPDGRLWLGILVGLAAEAAVLVALMFGVPLLLWIVAGAPAG